ncbi:sialin-like [Periplaneta americana]|uniref:sialin-like n=1 Tax=Periplaneta americana TaxID=6978 RepID=UPI0037E717AF
MHLETKEDKKRCGGCIPTRYVLCAMCFFAVLLETTLKVMVSVVLVAMVRHDSGPTNATWESSVSADDVCPGRNEDTSQNKDGEFDWDETLQAQVLAATGYGAVVTHVLGGRLSEIMGPKMVLGPGLLVSGLLSLLSPVAARLHVGAFITLRVLIGATSGVVMPAINVLIARWYAPEERTSVASVVIAGLPVSTIMTLSLSGVIANQMGWPIVFYIFGGITAAWFVPFMLLVYNSPEQHPRISDDERELIISHRGQFNSKVSQVVPWAAILKSVPLWAHVSMSTGYAWLGATLLSELPTYLSNILHFNLQASGIVAALPFLFATVSGMIFGFLSQWLRSRNWLSQKMAYRIFNTISAIGSSAFLFVITLVGCDANTIVLLLIISMVSLGGYAGGSLMNNLDLASNFAGTTSGITSTLNSVAAIITPQIVGALTNNQQTLTQWHIVFYISIGMTLASYLIFMVFGSVEEQPWNKLELQEKKAQPV